MRNLRISSRLIIFLTVAVNLIMLVATFLILRRLEENLLKAAREEIRAHALTLQLALEEDYATGRALDAQRLINRLSENTNIYGAILFNAQGQAEVTSHRVTAGQLSDSSEVERAIKTAQTIEVNRRVQEQDILSVISPLHNNAAVVGAIEIAVPISFVRAELQQERRNIALTAFSLSFAILLVALIMLYLNLTRPVQALLDGALAIGEGNLAHRVIVPRSSGELTQLAQAFNKMAQRLVEQRNALAREAEERLNLERKLRHSERLAAVGRLAAGVAHEMGAPLQVIDGRAKQLLDRADTPIEMRQRNLTIIRAQSDRITRIVRQLLNLARPYNVHKKQIVAVQTLIAEALETVELLAAQNNVQLKASGADALQVQGDADLLRQTLVNFCQNGVQAMPEGGTLTIAWQLAETTAENLPLVMITINDSGAGIAPENIEHIFDPFFTTKEVGLGTGLGLAVARRIIEEHGGTIEVANVPTGGAIFTIKLPQAEEGIA